MIHQLQSNLMKMKFSRIIFINSIFFFMLLLPNISYTQDEIGSFEFEGNIREYEVYLPENFQPNMPVVFALHGATENIQWFKNYTLLHEVADTTGFIVIYPNSMAPPKRWNTGSPIIDEPNVDDVGFISALIDTLDADYDIDMTRIYTCGFSAGGMMSYYLAWQLGHRLAAGASISGGLNFNMAANYIPLRAFPILTSHGTLDEGVPYDGKPGFLSVEGTVKFWIQNNNCSLQADTVSIPDLSQSDRCTVEKISYTNCSEETSILFYKIIDGGHNWPSSNPDITWDGEGNVNRDININIEILNFFKNYQNPLVNIAYGKTKDISHKNKYFPPEGDTLIVTAHIANSEDHAVTVYAMINGTEHASQDSIELFDDGLHGDGDASDNIYGVTKWLSGIEEDMYEVRLRTTDTDTGMTTYLNYPSRFTTIGPIQAAVIDDGFRYERQYIKLVLYNEGAVTTARNLKATISTTDPRVKEKEFATKEFPDLAAGITDTSSFSYYFSYTEGYVPDSTVGNPIIFDYTIYYDVIPLGTSDDIPYWTGSFPFTAIIVGVDNEQLNIIPKEFALEQNYPNPFNPETVISYRLPVMSEVMLRVYDVLGREVAILVNEQQKAGYYEIDWNAVNNSSGVYFYKIQAGEFVETKKMILIK